MRYNNCDWEEEVVGMDVWWDRHTRDWVIQLLDHNGYQVGEAQRCGNKVSRDSIVQQLKKEYQI